MTGPVSTPENRHSISHHMVETNTVENAWIRGQARIENWVRDTVITQAVSLFLILWFVVTWFVPLGLDEATLKYWLIATANPSPGWFLASFSHASIKHFLGNLAQLLVFGVIVERQLNTRQYLAFLAITGTTATLVQVVEYNLTGIEGGMIGASGATFAVASFALVTLLTQSEHHPLHSDSPTDLRPGLIFGGIVIVGGQLLNDFTPYLSYSAKASGIAHLTGILLGAGYALYLYRSS